MKKSDYFLIIASLTILFSTASFFLAFGQKCDSTFPPPSPTSVSVNVQTKEISFPCTGACVENLIQIWLVHEKDRQQTEYRDAGYLTADSNCSVFHYSALPEAILQREAKRLFRWGYGGGEFFYQYQVGATQSIKVNF